MLSVAEHDTEGVARFLDEVASGADEWRSRGRLPRGLFKELAATGFFAARWADGRRAGVGMAFDLIGQVAPLDGGLSLALSLHSEVFLATLARFPRHPLAGRLFREGLEADVVGAMAITEDHGGSNPAAIRTAAVRTGPETWQLRGAKRYISNLENATHCLLLVHGDDGARSGPTVFVLDLSLTGVDHSRRYEKLGTDSVGAWRLDLDLEISDDARLGPVGGGLAVLLGALRYERMTVSCAVLAGARYALGLSVEFLRQRESGDGRLYDLSVLSHRAAGAWTELEASTALFERLVERDQRAQAVEADFSAVKNHAARTSQWVTDEALQLLGGRGYTAAFPHERILRDIRLARIGAGTDEMMLEVVARHLDTSHPASVQRLAHHLAADQPKRVEHG